MLVPLKPILHEFKINLKGVLHIGVHWAEEHETYIECGASEFYYIEPVSKAFRVLLDKFSGQSNVVLQNLAIGSKAETGVMYVDTTNQGQSNSLLEPLVHLEQHIEVIFDGEPEIVKVVTLDSLEMPNDYNLLMVDTQGYELEVLKGASKTIPNFDIIYLEVNRQETYKGCPMIEDLDFYLKAFGFTRVATKWASEYHSWGDGVWVSQKFIHDSSK